MAHDSMACTSHQATALADSRTVTAAAMPSTSSPAGDQSGVRGLDALVTQLRMLRAQASEAQSLAAQLEAELADRKQCVCGCGCGCGCQTALPLTTSRRCRFAAESKRKTSLVATFQARRCILWCGGHPSLSLTGAMPWVVCLQERVATKSMQMRQLTTTNRGLWEAVTSRASANSVLVAQEIVQPYQVRCACVYLPWCLSSSWARGLTCCECMSGRDASYVCQTHRLGGQGG